MLKIGDQAPDFELLNQDRETVRLSDLRGKKVVVFAFPKAETPGCTMQACTFRDQFPKFADADVVILGVSTDSPEKLLKWKEKENLPYDLLSDPDHIMLSAWDAWGTSILVFKLPVATRSYWVLDEAGKVMAMKVPVGPKESVEQALAALDTGSNPVTA